MSQLHRNHEHHRQKSLLASMATLIQTVDRTKKEKTSKSINVFDRLTHGTCCKEKRRKKRDESSEKKKREIFLTLIWSNDIHPVFSLLVFSNRRLNTFDMHLVVFNDTISDRFCYYRNNKTCRWIGMFVIDIRIVVLFLLLSWDRSTLIIVDIA